MPNGKQQMTDERGIHRQLFRSLALACLCLGILALVLWLLVFQLGVLDLGFGVSPDPTPTSWPRTRLASPEYGMQASLRGWDLMAKRDLLLIHDAGFSWVKQHIGWRDVEGAAKGRYDWYYTDRIVADVEELGMDLLFRLDSEPAWAVHSRGTHSQNGPPENPQDFGDFCHVLADRYRGRVRAYQVWNEPNLAREWGAHPPDPAEYVELLKACYIGIKSADPNALVVSAGLSPTGNGLPEAIPEDEFLVGMYEAGASPYFDLLGVHAPGFNYAPEVSPDKVAAERGGYRFWCFRHVEDLREIMVRFGDEDKQVAVLEMGWTIDQIHPDYSWYAVSEEEQADYLVRAFRYAKENWSPWIGVMIVHSIADPTWTEDDEQYWWAITEPGWPNAPLRPAYEALRDMEK
jgi:hypothetical protein